MTSDSKFISKDAVRKSMKQARKSEEQLRTANNAATLSAVGIFGVVLGTAITKTKQSFPFPDGTIL